MRTECLHYHLDICRRDVDAEVFGAALAVEYINRLILNGGNEVGCPERDTSVHLSHIQNFVKRAVVSARKTNRFEQEWLTLQQALPLLQIA